MYIIGIHVCVCITHTCFFYVVRVFFISCKPKFLGMRVYVHVYTHIRVDVHARKALTHIHRGRVYDTWYRHVPT